MRFAAHSRYLTAFTVLALLMVVLVALPAWAATEDPLTLSESDPADGATGVAVNQKIKLVFSKNVVNMAVAENNEACFKLLNASDAEVPITVVLPDDQVEPERKREIEIVPKANLLPGQTYSVHVAPELKSKSGDTLGEEIVLTFTTSTSALPATGSALTAPAVLMGLALVGAGLGLKRIRR